MTRKTTTLMQSAFLTALVLLLWASITLTGCSAWEGHHFHDGGDNDDDGSALPRRKDLAVHGLEELVPAFADFDGDMYAGLLPMNNGKNRHGKLMFWLFVPRHTANPNALTLWLNGGPGCTSFGAGLFLENSPVTVPPRPAGYCCLQENEPLQYNKYAWTNASALLYVEQPVGVGFSFGGPTPINEDELSGDVYAWLLNFYKVFDEFQTSQLYVFGESYAGT
jgi:Serine carboxypeptidase